MKLYNTLTRKVENFKPQNPEKVKIYTCGPTVYSAPHIGNFAAYIYWDLLVRTLKLNSYTPYRILNLTDVGHLTSDGDDGEDKLEKGAKREGKTVWEIADFYIDLYQKDFQKLNLIAPERLVRATDYIEADKALVKTLIDKGYTYETKDGIYFDTSKFPHYADFAHLNLEQLKAGARVDFNPEKHNPSDFAIWKFIAEGEQHAMRWDFLDRPGYPGWHLECSTIIHEELGEPIDIHTGGIDHIPVHHTNEIAQSEAAFETELSRFWLHCNFITIEGQKVSKSLGNTYSLDDLAEKGFHPLDFKMWVLQGHYQGERNFTFDSLAAAKERRLGWRNQIALTYQVETQKTNFAPILEELNNNLNSAAAFALIDQQKSTDYEFWQKVDEAFGLDLINSAPDITNEQKQILNTRKEARAKKDWQISDRLRAELEQQGITVLDTSNGQIWQYL